MISCRDAKHLFDRYLDGELNPSLQTELHAHRLQCSDCQNELALLEACGDVISLDRREPVMSASFTDRVLLARRGLMKPVPRRFRLARTLLIIGSPMAAAACLALMFSLFRSGTPNLPHVVAPYMVAAPAQFRETIANRPLTQSEKRELDAMESMPAAGFVEALLAPVVEKSKNTAEGARKTTEDLLERLRESLSTTGQTLAVDWRATHPDGGSEAMGPPAPTGDQTSPDSGNSESTSPMAEPIHNPY